jgi:uncharacterized membrane protein YeiH
MEVQTITVLADILASITFAVTGALVASRKGLDIIAFMWLAVITGVGGGTFRDLVLGAPVFWIENTMYLQVCLITAVGVFLVAPYIESRHRLVLWFDALGLAFVTMAGTAKALDYGTGPLVAVVMGVVTGSVGGIIRDLIGQQPSIILRQEIYVTASVAGACTYLAFNALALPWLDATVLGFIVTFAVRGLAIVFNWSMPGYRNPSE